MKMYICIRSQIIHHNLQRNYILGVLYGPCYITQYCGDSYASANFSKYFLRDENNFHFLLKQHEQTIARDTEGGNWNRTFLSMFYFSFFFLFLFAWGFRSCVTRTLEFIWNHVPRCQDDYFMLMMSQSVWRVAENTT